MGKMFYIQIIVPPTLGENMLSLDTGICPTSPTQRIDTRPDGRTVIHVMLALYGSKRSNASGGNWSALEQIIYM
jgi:hypothetical protein